MAGSVTINGNLYTADGSKSGRYMEDGGFQDNLLPMFSDTMAVIAALLGGSFVISQSFQAPTSGATLTATSGLGAFIIEPAGTIAALTVVLPPSPTEGQIFELSTTQTITAISVSGASSETVWGAQQMLVANGGMSWRYRAADTTWYRRF